MKRVALALAILLLAAPLAALPAAGSLNQSAFEAELRGMQGEVDDLLGLYPQAVNAQGAVVDAQKHNESKALAASLRARFTYDGSRASDLEEAIAAASAAAIGDKVKAYTANLSALVEAHAPPAQVQASADQLSPNLNRLVIVAQGKSVPVSQRDLRTAHAVDAAIAEVRALVDKAVDNYKAGLFAEAKRKAADAFFTFETNGVGPDLQTVNPEFENDVENAIQNFNAATQATRPGLVQLIDARASLSAVEAKQREIHEGLDASAALLKNSIPARNLGDANNNGRIDIADALFVLQAALGIRPGDPAVMDVDGNGRIQVIDALRVFQVALGIRDRI